MGSMQAEVFEEFRDMGATEDKALMAASVLDKTGDDMNLRFAEIDVAIAGGKGEWVLATLFKLFAR